MFSHPRQEQLSTQTTYAASRESYNRLHNAGVRFCSGMAQTSVLWRYRTPTLPSTTSTLV